jgi:hypothetical protein
MRLSGEIASSNQIGDCYIIIIIVIYFNCKWFLPGGSGNTMRHNAQITHHAQTKHSTQNYTNNKGHTTHNEYNANTMNTSQVWNDTFRITPEVH